jgi:hypothetical protein
MGFPDDRWAVRSSWSGETKNRRTKGGLGQGDKPGSGPAFFGKERQTPWSSFSKT